MDGVPLPELSPTASAVGPRPADPAMTREQTPKSRVPSARKISLEESQLMRDRCLLPIQGVFCGWSWNGLRLSFPTLAELTFGKSSRSACLAFVCHSSIAITRAAKNKALKNSCRKPNSVAIETSEYLSCHWKNSLCLSSDLFRRFWTWFPHSGYTLGTVIRKTIGDSIAQF